MKLLWRRFCVTNLPSTNSNKTPESLRLFTLQNTPLLIRPLTLLFLETDQVELSMSGIHSDQNPSRPPTEPGPLSPRVLSPRLSWQDTAAPDGPTRRRESWLPKGDGTDEFCLGDTEQETLTLHGDCSLAGSRAVLIASHGAVLSRIAHYTPGKQAVSTISVCARTLRC